MSGNDAPEAVEHTANYPEAVWSQRRDPQSYTPSQQYKQSDPSSQVASPYRYAAENSSTYDGGVNGDDVKSKRNATICGISRALFIALVVLAVVIIGAAVGGGVGGSMAVRSAYNDGAKGVSNGPPSTDGSSPPTNTAAGTVSSGANTATPTAGSLYTAPTEGVQLALDCPRLTGEKVSIKYRDNYEASFTLACGADKIGRGFDLFGATVYTYTDCMRLCVSYNIERHTTGCQGVSFAADLSDVVEIVYANCILKNSTSDMSPASNRYLFASLNS
ncbi:hypothetical protein PG996_011353 [Apiospora saccharicola]|uniref:Apple domain-containing protein n=1 Tax=Apiospora saccharicola TaxID=335842 RepID=A0ABR1UEV6_9PEZI